MRIIFLRHGEAEELHPLGVDEARSLTDRGRRRTRKMLKAIDKLIPKKCRVQIWSSPLLRAVQTADVLAETYEIKTKVYSAISNGDLDSLLDSLAQLSKDDCVFIVGHQPFLSEWLERLTGVSLPFKKSGTAALWYDPAANDSSGQPEVELLWYVQPHYAKQYR